MDKNGDGKIQFKQRAAPAGALILTQLANLASVCCRMLRLQPLQVRRIENELYVDRDIIVLANPEIARLPNPKSR